ncbi:hypothetical protein P3X46_028457 [Hevea brasiliensis]|uniref:U-box domain-containing protein n=1 Tax=Hevea brasiliensis TaxID=3981 RepID=A0ABQ9KP30_HEVBR|nr:U-box domain-containing protein 28 [Hevea brasiliensis]KAJ9146153.1 hypothetical protein P3X46_028457 [Hevea brasiliensis]
MERNELYISVPNLFRCPISLDVMKSPVSLCTGVTYDRSSIQHWLDSGHDTCPATMQILATKDFVPNLTLHRLINLWAQSSTRLPDSGNSSVTATTVSEQQVEIWIDEIKKPRMESLVKIVEFLSYSNENRGFLVRFDDLLEAIVVILSRDGVETQILELIVRVLDLMLLENGVREKVHRLVLTSNENCLSSFLLVIQNGKSHSKIQAVRVLESISINNDSKRFVAETQNLMPVLFHLLKAENDPALHDAVLSLLSSIVITRSIKNQIVQLGLVQVISKTLSNKNAAVSLVEKSLKLASIVSTCADGRKAISDDPKCVGCIVERLMKVSKTATVDAVMVLWSLCCSFRDERVQEKVMRSNGLTKLLLVMQSEGEGNVRMMCADLVKVLRVGCKDGGVVMSYQTKTTHIMPC